MIDANDSEVEGLQIEEETVRIASDDHDFLFEEGEAIYTEGKIS